MYGFLRINNYLLTKLDRESYKHLYCGQCAALQGLFGYRWRTFVSYDAAFMGLLIAAQQDADFLTTKSWCGVFPKKMKVCSPEELPSVFSACMAVLIFSLKIADARQEGRPYWKGLLEKSCMPGFRSAKDILSFLDFPVELFKTISAEQQRIETDRRSDIAAYAEPSARFLAEVFRFTAKVTKNSENEDALYKMGYHTGRIIYLVDSCIDILDDMEKKEFNALLMASVSGQELVSQSARMAITEMVIDSLKQIRKLLNELHLKGHEGIIANILAGGFPATIQHRLQRSMKKLGKARPMLLKYLPHTALASALCLFTAQNADAAGWVSCGDILDRDTCAVGLSCGDMNYLVKNFNSKEKACSSQFCIGGFNIFVNPLYYICMHGDWNRDGPCGIICTAIIQGPKAYGSYIIGRTIKQRCEKLKDYRRREKEEESQRRIIEKEERKHQEAAELKRKNQKYIDKAMTEINSIESFFNTYPLGMGKKVIPQNFQNEILNFASSHQNEELSANKELKRMIAEKTEELRQIKSIYEGVMRVHKSSLDIYKIVGNAVNACGNMAIIKELELDYAELMSENVKCLLADRRWDDFKEVVQDIIEDMRRLHSIAIK